jgi:MinD-like ATPase involved in chromosome partitioning or flagellar assembly
MTPPTVDVEITSKTTARATLAAADVHPMNLEATDSKTLSTVVHEFLYNMARAQGAGVEVVYRTAKDTRFLIVGPDGKAEERAPSMPLPTITPPSPTPAAPAAAEPVFTPPSGPVVVAAEQITYETGLHPADASPPTPVGQRPAESATGPIEGLLDVHPQLSAPLANPAASDPARFGVRGRLNAVFGLKLTPKPDSLELRLREAQTTIALPLPEDAVITVANLKGGVGKTPMSISLAETLAEHRGPATVTCMDLGEVDGSFADRVAVPPNAGKDAVTMLAAINPETEVRPSTLARYLIRQPSGSDIIAGAQSPISYDDAAALGAILGRHRDVLIADTGNSSHAGSWRWAITAAHAVVVPVPLRRDAAGAANRTLATIAAVRPDILARTVVVITAGPGDAPMVETEAVTALPTLRVPVCRMPFEPLFASGERIALSQLQRETQDALTRLAATVVALMAGAMG